MSVRRPADALKRRPGLFALVALACAVSLALPAAAVATPLSKLDVTLLTQSQGAGEPLMLIAGEIAEDVTLPAEIVLPVPEGATIEWSGEILGGDAQEDPSVEGRLEQRDGTNVVVFTLTQSRIGQAEVSFPGAVTAGDQAFTAAYDMAAPVAVESARYAIALPPGGQPTSLPEGVLSAPGPQNYTYFYLEAPDVNPGDPITFSMQFTQSAAPVPTDGGTGQPASGEVPTLLIVLIAAALAGAVLVVLAARSRSRGAAGEGAADDEVAEDLGDAAMEHPVHASAADAAEAAAHSGPDADQPEAPPTIAESTSWLTPQRLLVIAGILVVGIIVAVMLGGQEGQVGVTQISDGLISQRISTAEPASTVELNAIIACDCPPESEAPKMFDALRTVPGVAHAELEESSLLLRVQYDPALTDEAAIATALRAAGYLQ